MTRYVVLGAGAIGGFLAARLALAGHPVALLARGDKLAAIRADGLRLTEADGRVRQARSVQAVAALDQAPEALGGPPSALLLCVKAHQVGGLREALVQALAAWPQAGLVAMVNGVPWWYFQGLPGPWQGRHLDSVDPGGELARAIDPARVIGAVVYPAAEVTAPGCVRVVEGQRFSLGELDGRRSERVAALAADLIEAGFKAPVSRDLRAELWVKLWGNLSFNPVSALTHATLAQIAGFAPTRAVIEAMMAEAEGVARALGVVMRVGLAQRLAGAEAVGDHKTSMLQDVEAGRETELPALLGAVVELATITGVPTPTLRTVWALAQLAASQALGAGIRRGAA